MQQHARQQAGAERRQVPLLGFCIPPKNPTSSGALCTPAAAPSQGTSCQHTTGRPCLGNCPAFAGPCACARLQNIAGLPCFVWVGVQYEVQPSHHSEYSDGPAASPAATACMTCRACLMAGDAGHTHRHAALQASQARLQERAHMECDVGTAVQAPPTCVQARIRCASRTAVQAPFINTCRAPPQTWQFV